MNPGLVYPEFQLVESDTEKTLIEHFLLESYDAMSKEPKGYPFVENLNKLRPGAYDPTIPEEYVEHHNNGLVVLVEKPLPKTRDVLRVIQAYPHCEVNKENLDKQMDITVETIPDNHKLYDNVNFSDLLKTLTSIDYAVLIQPWAKMDKQYASTHAHVRIDKALIEVAEDLIETELRYTRPSGKKLEEYLEMLCLRFINYFGFEKASGNRTAGMIASYFLSKRKINNRIYVGSKQARDMTKITPYSIERFVLVNLNQEGFEPVKDQICASYQLRKNVAVLKVPYHRTEHAHAIEKKSKRVLESDFWWTTVPTKQYLVSFDPMCNDLSCNFVNVKDPVIYQQQSPQSS